MRNDQQLTSHVIDHWSYSSMMKFLSNAFAFKKQYILKIYDFKSSPAAVVGKAGHKALEMYYKNGGDADKAAAVGMAYIDSVKDDYIEWGLTGSRAKVIQNFTKGFNGYIEEARSYNKILGVELSLTSFIEHGGKELAIPAKSVSDLIIKNDKGEIEIIDHKFVTTYTKSETEDGGLVFQAMFNYYNVKNKFGKAPVRMIYNEYKISKNKNKDAQLQPYIIEFKKHPDYVETFINLYNVVTQEISRPDYVYLPNFQERYDISGETFKDYKAQIVTVESPIIVQHKTGDFQFKDKEFVSSPVNITDNKHLVEEEKIRIKLLEFGIPVEMQETHKGSSIIQYTLKASRGIKMSQFEKYASDLALALKAKTIRVQAPIMGTDLVGIEVPNINRSIINFYDKDKKVNSNLNLEFGTTNIPIGVDVYGNTIIKALDDMPHLLIAGATGAGKSVMINVIVKSLAAQNTADELKFVMIDPKRVELVHFKNLPNLIPPIIYDTDKAIKALYWVIDQMEERYKIFEDVEVRNIKEYSDKIKQMYKIVVIIDEFADLVLQGKDIGGKESADNAIVRLAQKARAVGIHLILGTQRPSVDVVTGLIKANFSTRIAFMTSSRVDSQVILDQPGAEELVGAGDMLFLDPHSKGLKRLQGYYV